MAFMIKQKTLFITGAAGYIGAMLVEQFAKRPDVAKVIGLDKETMPEIFQNNKKIIYIKHNTSDAGWEELVGAYSPEVIIHTAWQIREIYDNRALEWKWNIDGSDRVFDFAFSTPSVKKLIHFSTVSSYGATPQNTTTHLFTEDEPFNATDYLYAYEKNIAEEHLYTRYNTAKTHNTKVQVFIVRPAAITGPRGRVDRIRFGLQSVLSGSLKGRGSFLYSLISLMVSFVPVTSNWLRQYLHEDDVTDIIALFSFNELDGTYEVFNIAPPGPAVLGKDMAKAVGKRIVPIRPWMVRVVFFFIWHLTRGKIPTSPGSWKWYSYPIAVDGSKLTKQYGYIYRWGSKDSFIKNEGRYVSTPNTK